MTGKTKEMKKIPASVPFHPYAHGLRPSRCKWTDFEVDGRSFEILGIRDSVASCARPAGYPDDPDEQIGQALVALVKGWA